MTNKIEDFIKLADAVPAQDLARALLEAEDNLTQSTLDLSYYIHLATKAKTKNKWIDSEIYKITMTLERLNKTLATIQKLKI